MNNPSPGEEPTDRTAHRPATPVPPPPSYWRPPAPAPKPSKMPTAALTLGIVGWVALLAGHGQFNPYWDPVSTLLTVSVLPTFILAVVFGVLGRRRIPHGVAGRGSALAGLVLGYVGLALIVILIVLLATTPHF